MTAYSMSLSGRLSFVGGYALWPGPDVYPGADQWPNPGEVHFAMARNLPATASYAGALSAGSARVRTVTGVFAPTTSLNRVVTRSLIGAVFHPVIAAFSGNRTAHALTKLLTASLVASGRLTVARVLPPSVGGGGFATPMSDDFFHRYKPTLRRQRQR